MECVCSRATTSGSAARCLPSQRGSAQRKQPRRPYPRAPFKAVGYCPCLSFGPLTFPITNCGYTVAPVTTALIDGCEISFMRLQSAVVTSIIKFCNTSTLWHWIGFQNNLAAHMHECILRRQNLRARLHVAWAHLTPRHTLHATQIQLTAASIINRLKSTWKKLGTTTIARTPCRQYQGRIHML
jgi:hypothetical protein